MKYILSTICLTTFLVTGVSASELIGKISTDPSVLANILNGTSTGQSNSNQDNSTNPTSASADTSLLSQNQKIATTTVKRQTVSKLKTSKKIKVLGISLYPDGSLLRDSYHRIYLIKSGFKKRIINLQELQKYQGQSIYDVTNDELSWYQTKSHLDGELIKEKGKPQIFVIVNSKKKLIPSLNELQKKYSGLEIFNISREEMSLY